MTPRAPVLLRTARRDAGWVLGVLVLAATLVFAGTLIRGGERDRRHAALVSLTERAQTSAALTDSVFKALGALSASQLAERYGGPHVASVLRDDLRRSERAGGRPAVFVAVADAAGRPLGSVGSAPRRFAPVTGRQAHMTGVLPAGPRSAVQFVVPFQAADGSRRALVQGLSVAFVRSFLGDFLARLPNPDGARLTMTDGAGVTLARRAVARGRRTGAATVAASAVVPGTSWRLVLAAPRDRVFAGVYAHRWVPWLLLAALSLAGLVGLALMRRLQRTALQAHRAARELAVSQDELENLIAALDEGVARRDPDGRVRLLNESARRHVGTAAADFGPDEMPWRLLDAAGDELAREAHPSHRAAHGEPVNGVTLGLEDAAGARRWLRFSACPLTGDGAPPPYPVVMSFTDITAQRELELHLTRLAECDPLTGLPNRRRFEEGLEAQLERCRRDGARAALVTLDIDRFKEINDSRGHLAGDEVLRAMAAAVQSRLRAADLAGRLGGDEFAILLCGADGDQARETAADFVRRIRDAVGSGLDGVEVTVTYGVAELDGASSVKETLDASDRDMYRHKPRRAAGPDAAPPSAAQPGPPHGDGDGDGDRPQALAALYAAVRACDAYTASHSRDVVALSRAVAIRLGLDEAVRTEVEHVALIHDIGKIAIPDSILRKPGGLSWEEEVLMRQHPVIGAQIVGAIDSLRHLAPAVRAEHERWDGGGYPDGLAGARIPVASRIVLVCDAYHAMTSDRPYRASLDETAALAELRRHAGTQFCPEATAALLDVLAARSVEDRPALAPVVR